MRRKELGLGALSLLLLVAAPDARAQVPGPTPVGAPADQPAETKQIRFNFKGATFEQVVEFFARTAGLPVVWETEPPDGTLDYLSPESYELPEAMSILNIILQSRGVMLRLSKDMLYLQKLSEMQREDIPTFVGSVPAEVTGDQIITVVCPLNIAVATGIAEKLASMVAEYGSVTALDQQNAIVLTETAAQVRRLLRILDELDREDPEGAIELIPIRHAKATDLMEPLKALLSKTVERVVLDQKNKPKKIQQQEMTGLSISADARTNTIIAKGVQSRIDKLRETISLLDVATSSDGRSMQSFPLRRLAPAEAARTLEQLYARLPEEQRPTLLAHERTGRLTIIGPPITITEAAALLEEIDGSGAPADTTEQMVVLPVTEASPGALLEAMRSLLSPRQVSMLKLLPGPDGRSIILSGPGSDVDAAAAMVPALDRRGPVAREVRLVRVDADDPAGIVRRTQTLYDRQVAMLPEADRDALSVAVEVDAATRTMTLVGTAAAIDRFQAAMRAVEQHVVVTQETRQIALSHAVPSEITRPLLALATQLLKPRDGRVFTAPTMEAVDELDLLLVTAPPAQFEVIGSLIETLDRPGPGDFEFRIVSVAGVGDVDVLLDRADAAFDRLQRGVQEPQLRPDVSFDDLTGNVTLSGDTQAVAFYEQALEQARRLLPPPRRGQLLDLEQANALDVVGPLRDLWARMAGLDGGRVARDPEIEVIERTNSLYVVAEDAQHAVIARLVRELDTLEPGELPPLRLLQVRAADAAKLATLLRNRYDARPAEQRREQPVTLEADPATNTLVVTAHETVFEDIRSFIESINESETTTAERETMIFALKRARAPDLAAALEKLYPEPPVPVDRRGNPLLHLREPREVYVSADAATNTLIVEAPAERRASFTSLVEQLDRVELPPRATLRTFRLERGDPQLIARTLQELARKGVLSEQPADGSKPVDVLIEVEPTSRTLIVAGDEVTFAQTEAMLHDLEAVPVMRTLRIFEIAGADPQAMAEQAQRLYAEQTAGAGRSTPVTVEVDRDKGVLLVVAEDEAMIRFAGILDQLEETVGPPPDVRLIALEHADASEVVAFLRDLAGSHLTMVGDRAGPTPQFEAIERTNSVLVAAQREQHDIITALISGLDQMEPGAMPPLRILQLRTADAGNLASALTQLYNQRPLEERNEKAVRITADAQTNALIVAAHPEVVPEIQAIVDELNSTNRIDDEGREIRIFPLQVARAEELARTIDEMFPAPPVPVDRRGNPMPHLQEPREVVVRADSQTNALIVDAPIQRMAGFEQLVEQLDRAQMGEETEIRTYPVLHAELDQVALTLRELASSGTLSPASQDRRVPITVRTEPVSHTLIVAGPLDIFDRVEQVLAELDVKRAGPTTTLRFYRLRNARAETLAPMLREILLLRIGQDVPDAGSNVASLLDVTADGKTNTLIISAPASVLPVVEQLIEQLDDDTAAIGEPIIRVRTLTFAAPDQIARALTPALPSLRSPVTGEPVDVKLIAAADSNAIVLVGLEEDLAAVEALIEPLDARPATDAIDARTFPLTHAAAGDIARMVEGLLTDQLASDPRFVLERIRRSRGPVDPLPRIRVEADERTNSLIVSGPQRSVALAETLITELDRPDEGGPRIVRTFTPQRARPGALAGRVARVLEATRDSGRVRPASLVEEPESGSILITGSAESVAAAMSMLAERDAETLVPPALDLRIVPIEHAEAGVIARTVGPLLADPARWPDVLQRASRAGIAVAAPAITADASANRLLVSGPRELMPLALELIGQLDQPRAGAEAMDVRVFRVTHADTGAAAEAVRAALAAEAARHPGLPPATVVPEPGSGTLVVTAAAEQLAAVESMLAQIDTPYSSEQPQVRTVFLRHARAETVVPIVQELLAAEELPIWMRISRGALIDTGPDVRVAADTRLNAVIISAPPSLLNVAEEMVGQLDADPEQDPMRRRQVQMLLVQNAEASDIATSLTAMFDAPDAEETPPTIRVDQASNSLLIRATTTQFRTIAELVAKIDRATLGSTRQMSLISIDPARASARDIARTLEQLLDRGNGGVQVMTLQELLERRLPAERAPAGSSSRAPAAAPLAPPASPALPARWTLPFVAVVGTPPAAVDDAVAAFLKLITTPARPDAVPAAPLARAESRLAQAAPPPDARAELEASLAETAGITIAVDDATNSLVIVGSPRAIERITELARAVEKQLPAAPARVRYIALPPEADAAVLVRLIDQTLRRLTPPGGTPGSLRTRTAVIADESSNALVVTASDADFETIGDLIAALATPGTPEAVVVKVYPLRTITADRAERSVQNLIGPPPGRGRGRQAQRVRAMAITLLSGDRPIEAVLNPEQVHIAADPQTNTLVVRAPEEALRFIDEYIALIDQTPVNVQTTLKLYPLQHARAEDLRGTLDRIFTARFRSLRGQPGAPPLEPEFAADERTNTLLVTAGPEQLAEVDGLLRQLDKDHGQELFALRSIEMQAALPTAAAQIIEQVVLGSDQQRRAETTIVPDDNSGVLLVRASPAVSAEIDAILEEIDRDASRAFPVRTITLERASASAVAAAVQRFFDDRAQIASSGRGRRQQARRISIIGDEASRTLLIAASEGDFAEVQTLVEQFDTPQATDAWTFRVLPLRHARASDIEAAVEGLVSDLTWNQGPFIFNRRGGSSQPSRGSIAVRADTRLNALIVTGEGDKFDLVEEMVTMLDAPPAERDQRTVRLYRLEQADPREIGDLVEELYADPGASRRWWEPAPPDQIKVRVDERSRTLIVSATVREHEEVAVLLEEIDGGMATPDQQMTVLPVEFAAATDLARTLSQFLRDRARATGGVQPSATIAASESANSLIVSATEEDLATMRDLLDRLDQPDVSGDREVQIIALQEGDAEEIGRVIREQFGRRSGQGVVVTADIRTNSLIINAPSRQLAQVQALVAQLDTPGASDETIIRTYALVGARADEAVRILSETLQLSPRGETSGITIRLDEDSPAVEVRAKIVADPRSNSVIVTATAESFPVIAALIQQLDEVPAASPVEYRIIPLAHAMADDVAFTMGLIGGWREVDGPRPRFDYNRLENQLIVSARSDQFEQIEKLVRELDQPSERTRVTDFVPLQFAEAEKIQEALSVFYGPYALEADTPGKRNVRIVADPATNSLVISADETEWADIRALLSNLDSQEYDASLQLKVIPLTYASARSVARAINEAFQGSIDRDRRSGNARERPRTPTPSGNADERREPDAPTVLVEAEEWVRASAEEQTNSVIVSASRQNIRKIEQIIEQLDVADYAKLPPPRLIPVTAGDPVPLAAALNQLYEQEGGDRGQKGLRIVGDSTSGTLIVRAEEEEFAQIRALAEALQQEASAGGLAVRVLPLRAVPARRVADAIRTAFEAKAERSQQSLSIQVDTAGNNLIVAASAGLFQEIEATVNQLDALAPAAGQGIFIIELENVAPESVKDIIETIGLDQAGRDDGPGRLVSEPIKVTVLTGRNAIVVVANPVDRDTIVGIVKALDREPELAESELRVVKLLNADATALANILSGVLAPGDQQSQTPLARAVQEQVRRLAVRRNGLDEPEVRLDLTKPIRVLPDDQLNALVISSTPENVAALLEVVAMFDQLPITDAVTVQLFPLVNIAAGDFVRIVRELFEQGKQLATVPGTQRDAMPGGMVGRALLDEIALTIDERTNTVIVAGKEDSVALVEVMTRRLDTDVAIGWVETRVLPLTFADATDLAETLEAILVRGATDGAQALPLQRQIGRLRLLHDDSVLESQVFQPMGRLVIRPEPQLNAIILLGAPENLKVVGELVTMLDVEAASPDATVRIYPIEHASAAQLQATITGLFDQQVESKAIRPEDRLIVQADARTNALIVTTSPRSFAVLDGLLRTLDADVAPDLRAIRRIDVNHASATRLAPLIQELMDARLERLRQVQPETADLERATIVADPRTNALVVAAGNDAFAVIERLTHDLDESTLSDTSLVQVIPVTQGGAERLAETIDAVMARRYSDLPEELRRSQLPLVITDPRTSSLLVAANADDLAAIEDLVQRLESAPLHPAVGLHVVSLPPSVSAEQLAPRIQRLMRERQQSLGDARQPSDMVTVEPDPIGNTLIVAGSAESLAVVEGLVEVLITAGSEAIAGRGFEVIPLRASQADDVVQLLEDLYVDEANRTRGPGAVQVTADDRVNAVLVSGTQADVAAVRNLTAELDGAKPATVVEIKYIALDSANALETVGLIENVLSGRGLDGRRGRRPATVVKYLQELAREQGEEGLSEIEVSAAIRESISLTPDLRTNTIIVSAPRQSMAMIERMIRDLDMSSTGAKNIRIFKLENADATAMAEILSELFNLRQGNNLLVLKPSELAEPAPGGTGEPGAPRGFGGTELTAVPDERQQLSITVDSRTNSLLVSGTPTYLDLVEEVVIELDALKANEREVLVYQLHNAQADEVARVLGDFVQEEQRKLVETLSADQIGSAARLLEREVTIQGDALSNSVLVSASPRYMDRVRQMIEQLDIDPPQVLIQVMLAEVTLDSSGEWGVDFDAAGRIGSAAVSGGFGFATAFVTGVGVPNLAIASEDFNLLIRAMESQGRLQVLSNPSVMAANNQPARIQVGETIRVPESTQFTDGGNSNTNTVEEDVGVILEVTPTINPDGFVRMVVAPEISILSQRTTQINENLESPVITIRTASTTVTVHDGQTIVIGGLISDRFERRDRKVPLLGDIPFFGELFRSESEESVKTELLIVLTPHVVQSPAEFGRVSELTTGEIGRLSLPERLKQRMREGQFDLGDGLFDAEGNPIPLDTRPADAWDR